MSWLREVFSENGTGSFSRVASGFHTVGALAWITHFVVHTNTLPDPGTMAGLAAFVTAPYASGKISTAISAFSGSSAPKGS